MIIQGTNRPIILSFQDSMEDIKDIEVCLYGSENAFLKHWDIEDISIEDKKVICPITQYESINFTPGKCHIEVKWMNEYGETCFAKTLNTTIVERYCKSIMEGAD